MTKENLQEIVFYVSEEKVIECSYEEYLNDFGTEKTTSPRGVESKVHIREVENEEGEVVEWEIWSWGHAGSYPKFSGISFESEEDAKMYMYEVKEDYLQKNWNAPVAYASLEEAEAEIIEKMHYDFDVDMEVAASIYRKRKVVGAERASRETAHRAKIDAETAARKAYLAHAVPAEAATIKVDSAFIEGVEKTSQMKGMEKNNYCVLIMKELMARQGIEKIVSDFWQVFRILKQKAEQQKTGA